MRLTALILLVVCAACAPAAGPQAVRLDDVSAAAYQAGRTQQAAQTQDAGTATAAARADAWTVTAVSRTEIAALVAATLQAGADQATARALTPTLTPIPSATPVPTATPRPTWTMTPDATVAALVVDRARAERDTAERSGWLLSGVLAVIALGVLVLVLYGAGRLWASWEYHMARAARERHISAGPYYDTASGQIVGLLPAPAAPAAPDPEPPATDAQTAEAARQWGWRTAVLQIAMYATEADSWAYSALGPSGWGVVSRPGWDTLTEYLSECGIIVKRPQAPTRWADGVDAAALAELVRGRGLPRAYPLGPAPILTAPRTHSAQAAQGAQAAQKGF